jgi:uncharacterized membrane protein
MANNVNSSDTIVEVAANYEVTELIIRGFAFAIIIAGFLSVVFIFVGGISFILSGGQEDKIKSAVGTIRYAIIGLVITILATAVVGIVGRGLGVDLTSYIDLGVIIDTVSNIIGSDGGSSASGGTIRSLE